MQKINSKSKLNFSEFLHSIKNKKHSKLSKYKDSNKLKKVLDFFIEPVENHHNLDDFFAYKWLENILKYKNNLINNSNKTKLSAISKLKKNNPLKDPTEINKVLIIIKEKSDIIKEETSRKIYGRPLALKLTTLIMIAFISSLSVCRFAPELSYKIAEKTDSILLSKISKLYKPLIEAPANNQKSREELVRDKEIFIKYINNNQANLNRLKAGNSNTFLITKDELFGQIAIASGDNEQKEETSKSSFGPNDNIQYFLGYFIKLFNSLSEKQKQISNNLGDKFTNYLKQ